MLDFDTVMERIKDVLSKEIGDRKVYNKDVAAALGITPEHLSVLKKRQKLPLKEILDFCARRSISANWLLYDQDPHSLCEKTDRFVYVRYFKEIGASAGGGALNYELQSDRLYIDEKIVAMLGGKQSLAHIEALHVRGDSMEPLLKDGSIVFLDRRQKDVKKGGIFVVSTNVGLFIKRVVLRLDGRVELLSENREYSPELFLPEEIEVVGKVVGVVEKV